MKPNRSGAASVEVAAMIPVVALFILMAFQFSSLLSSGTLEVAKAQAEAMRAIREWEEANAARGFRRPCLEEMDEIAFGSDGSGITLGAGDLSRTINTSQEVRVVSEPICMP